MVLPTRTYAPSACSVIPSVAKAPATVPPEKPACVPSVKTLKCPISPGLTAAVAESETAAAVSLVVEIA